VCTWAAIAKTTTPVGMNELGFLLFSLLFLFLFYKIKRKHCFPITIKILPLQVLEELPSFRHQAVKTSFAMHVFGVHFEVLLESINLYAQNGYLNWGRTGVPRPPLKLLHCQLNLVLNDLLLRAISKGEGLSDLVRADLI